MKAQITTTIQSFFAQFKILAGIPQFIFTTNKVIVQVPYYARPGRLLTETKINALVTRLSLICPIELRLVRLQYPYLDSSILAQYLGLNAGKYNFLRMKKMLFKKQANLRSEPFNLPSWSTGVKMEIAGRLTTQRSIPRKTVTNAHKGSFTVSNKLNSSLDLNQYTSKNKLGAHTVKVWLSQRNKLPRTTSPSPDSSPKDEDREPNISIDFNMKCIIK
jgi:ribosomal protein S3